MRRNQKSRGSTDSTSLITDMHTILMTPSRAATTLGNQEVKFMKIEVVTATSPTWKDALEFSTVPTRSLWVSLTKPWSQSELMNFTSCCKATCSRKSTTSTTGKTWRCSSTTSSTTECSSTTGCCSQTLSAAWRTIWPTCMSTTDLMTMCLEILMISSTATSLERLTQEAMAQSKSRGCIRKVYHDTRRPPWRLTRAFLPIPPNNYWIISKIISKFFMERKT